MRASPHLEWIRGGSDSAVKWNLWCRAFLSFFFCFFLPGVRACAGIQVPIIFTSNVNQRTRTRQSPPPAFGMVMGCIHGNTAIFWRLIKWVGWDLQKYPYSRFGLCKGKPQVTWNFTSAHLWWVENAGTWSLQPTSVNNEGFLFFFLIHDHEHIHFEFSSYSCDC